MRFDTPLKTLITIATFATLTACAPAPGMYGPDGSASVTVIWDSAPLDRDYHQQYDQMVVRHHDEDDHPQYNESAENRQRRHNDENKDMDRRYQKGKKEHRDRMPDSDR